MRQRFEQQLSINVTPIPEVNISLKSRDELAPMLLALKHIFVTKELNEQIFSLLEQKYVTGKKKTGRPGMDLWHILILAVVRHACDTNWDKVHWMANNDVKIRSIMGVPLLEDDYEFGYQSIIDNVSLLDDLLLLEINQIVAHAGQQMFKKKELEPLQLKTDSYVLETNVHFPTDLNLLWDSSRKCIDTISKINKLCNIQGTRKLKFIKQTLKAQFRATSFQVFKGKKEATKKIIVHQYLKQTKALIERSNKIMEQNLIGASMAESAMIKILQEALKNYTQYMYLFNDQIYRRLIKNEVIPASEKVYSIFEPHTEWITKGKLNKRIELGHLLLITTDQNHLIVDYKIMDKERDASQIQDLIKRINTRFDSRKIASHSFDKGFYSKDNYDHLVNSKIDLVVLPKKGKLNKEEKEHQSEKQFKKIRNKHSAIESNINMLEHHGLNKCTDKGMHGYKRCVGLSVLAYNLHFIGNQILAIEKQKINKIKTVQKAEKNVA
jgi:transposase, IS5 family